MLMKSLDGKYYVTDKYYVIESDFFIDIFIVKNNRRQFALGEFLYSKDAQEVCDKLNKKKDSEND